MQPTRRVTLQLFHKDSELKYFTPKKKFRSKDFSYFFCH